MTRAGNRLRAFASRLCCAETMERVVDPLIADLQLEYAKAVHTGSLWRSRWIRIAGGVALLKVIALCGGRSAFDEGTADEHRAMARTITFSAVAMCALVALCEAPYWRTLQLAVQAQQTRMFLYLIPQALPIAFPIGLTIGILFGFRGRVVSARSKRAVLTMAVAWSAISFAILAWVLPAANQSYREWVFRTYGQITPLLKGTSELTLAELSGQIESYRHTAMAGSSLVRDLTFSYHQRWSLACATAVLALFALGVLGRRPSARWTLGLAAVGGCFAYYTLLFLGRSAALGGSVPAFAGAWLPNVVFVLVSILLLASRQSTAPSPA